MKFRRGSALLVVLGMLAFMVISGVAFSVFMRATRLPSSFTRRVVSTRQLAKAALAEAIDQIDRAVANDPHPGVRNRFRSYYASTTSGLTVSGDSTTVFDPDKIDNFWAGHILIGQGETTKSKTDSSSTAVGAVPVLDEIYYPKFVEPDETVPVLTLEALAYLPPPLVNEARYYGQLTPTAGWQTFDFDAGRYAYVAVDVSDYFDIHRILAHLPRSSNPATRVTMGHFFEKDTTHEQDNGSNGPLWESTFASLYRNVSDDGAISFGSKVPFVSMADFNLSLGGVKPVGLLSPFVEYINGSGDGFYGAQGGPQYERYEGMTFVTDSLMATRPQSEMRTMTDLGDVLNLADDANQVFPQLTLHASQENRTLYAVSQTVSPSFTRLTQRRVPRMTMFQLSDYLDWDRIPISLGLPSVERVPMICGIQPNLGSSPNVVLKRVIDQDDQPDSTLDITKPVGTQVVIRRKVHWRIDPASLQCLLGGVSVLVAYPFRNHENDPESGYFTLDGKVQFFLSTQTMPLRTGDADDSLHWGAGGSGTIATPGNPMFVANSVFNLPLQDKALSFTAPQKQEDYNDYVKQFDMTPELTTCMQKINDELKDDKGDILCVTFKWTRTLQAGTGDNPNYYDNKVADSDIPPSTFAQISSDAADKPTASFLPLGTDGKVDSTYLQTVVQNPANAITFTLNYVPTIRVRGSAAVCGSTPGPRTVDMVPASIADDKAVNNVDNTGGLGALFPGLLNNYPTPLMKFETAVSFSVLPQSSGDDTKPVAFTPSAVMVNDPRYNHAPENWQLLTTFSPQGWYDVAKASAESRDGDVFMASSDQDYMQSPYEFAFLPRYSDLVQYTDAIRGDLPGYPNATTSWTKMGDPANTPIDAAWMWKTYAISIRGTGNNQYGPDDFEGLGFEYEGPGLRVNPYSDNQNVLLSAFANTPHDWRVASDDVSQKNPAGSSGDDSLDDVVAFNKKHAWNEYSQGAGLCWDELETIAERYRLAVKSAFYPKDKGIAPYGNNDAFCLGAVSDNYTEVLDDAFHEFFGNATGTDAEKYLCGLNLDDECSPVYSVDKKFLYGYWKSCFAARQQLYLVFFRAEPLALGGGIAGATPPQLGARGVALVWRDPYDPHDRKNSSGSSERYYPSPNGTTGGENVYFPHQTRVLFYRQFE